MRASLAVSILTATCALLPGCQNRGDDKRLRDLEGRVSALERRMLVTRSTPETAERQAAPNRPAPASAETSAVPAQDPTSAEPVLRSSCKTKWPTNFEMEAYCQEQQREAVAKLNRPFPSDLPADACGLIRRQCAAKWPYDYEMREYCEGQQIEGYRAVHR